MKFTLGKRLALGLGLIVALNLLFSAWVFYKLQYGAQTLQNVSQNVSSSGIWSEFIKQTALTNLGYMDAIVDKASQDVEADIVEQKEFFNQWLGKNEAQAALSLNEEEKKEWAGLRAKIKEWDQVGSNLFADIRREGETLETGKYDDVLDGVSDEMITFGSRLFSRLETSSRAGLEEINSEISKLARLQGIAAAILMLVLCLIGLLLYRSLKGELARLSADLAHVGGDIKVVASEMENSSSSLDQMTSSQAAAVQETVSSMNEISAMVERSLENANRAFEQSKVGIHNADNGMQSVQEIVAAISNISTSNEQIMSEVAKGHEQLDSIVSIIRQIGEKSKVINDIVFQTKLLSFNASVEAARAGEQGKGFAVVAEEVGNLASMSGKAADEITAMLEKSIAEVHQIVGSTKTSVQKYVDIASERVKEGMDKSKSCVEAFKGISSDIASFSKMVEEIAHAAKEQTIGVGEVTRAMDDLDSVAHKGRSVASNNSTLARDLMEKTKQLEAAVTGLDHLLGLQNQAALIDRPVVVKKTNPAKKEMESPVKMPIQDEKPPQKLSDIPDSNDARFKEL